MKELRIINYRKVTRIDCKESEPCQQFTDP